MTGAGRSQGEFSNVLAAFSHEPRYRRSSWGALARVRLYWLFELARQLLEDPESEVLLPLILPAHAWNPVKQSLRVWLAEQLVGGYSLSWAYARALVADGMILPILDGLDEMPSSFRSAALSRINEYLIYRPLVVTSRKAEYRAAQKDAKVQGMMVVQVMPLRITDIKEYLFGT